MSKFYIYCSNNQAYHALIQNSIMSKSVMRDDFRSDTASYLSKDYVFVTKSILAEEVKYFGVAEAYYPVVLEVEFDETAAVPVRYATLSTDGITDVSEEKSLSEYDEVENVIGGFVCGEIPIAYLSAIIFDNEEQQSSFKKSSMDLWFPEELYAIKEEQQVDTAITIDVLRAVAEKVDVVLTDEETQEIRSTVSNRSRMKAAAYYAIEATADWSIGAVRGNLDSTLLGILNKETQLSSALKKSLKKLGGDSISYNEFLKKNDSILEAESSDINKKIFDLITKNILMETPVRTKISPEVFNAIGQGCMDLSIEDKQDMLVALQTISKYLGSNMDPDEALRLIGKYGVLKAFMIFMDQQDNADFLKRATSKLSQTEKRYAYIMYGLLNGMSEVERAQKSNRALELRLEELSMEVFKNEHLINAIHYNVPFVASVSDEEKETFGIVPKFNIWYDCETSQKILLNSADAKILEKVYLAMTKTSKDDPILEQDIYAFKEPVVITVQVGETILETYPIFRKKDAKDFGKKIERVLKSEKEVFNIDGFKRYLSEEKRYQKFYRKNADMIQELCRKVK